MRRFGTILKYAILSGGVLIVIFPFLWMISTSLKDLKDVFAFPIRWIPEHPRWSNYLEVIRQDFHVYYLNTIKVAGLITLMQVVTSSMAAYAFSKLNFPGRNKIFMFYVATMMIPMQAILIPQFKVMNTLGLVNNHWSVILIYAASPFGVFMMRQFFITVPGELIESARIDGCGELRIFVQVMLPIVKPAIAALTTLVLMWAWNEMLLPLIYFYKKSLHTIPLGLLSLNREHEQAYHLQMAGTVMGLLPIIIIYFCAQRYFIEGITAGSVKG